MCGERYYMLLHMNEIPMEELVFFGRRMSIFYTVLFTGSLVYVILFYQHKTSWLIIGGFELALMLLSVILLRLVIWKQTSSNTFWAVVVSSLLFVLFVFTTLYAGFTGFYKLLWSMTVSFGWLAVQGSTAYILYGFRKKFLAMQGTENAVKIRTALLDKDIIYANT